MSTQAANQASPDSVDEILELARNAGLLVTLDGRIGRSAGKAGRRTGVPRFACVIRRSGLHG